MKFLLQLILTAALGALLQLVLPSWIIAVVAFVMSMLFARNGFTSFLNGFLAIANGLLDRYGNHFYSYP